MTGGSRGIGAAIVPGTPMPAPTWSSPAASSRIVQRSPSRSRHDTGRKALAVGCHVARWEDCDRLVDTVFDTFGHCDVFVNNAGVSPLYPDLASVTEEYYDKVTGVNLKGPFRLGALVGTRMAAGDGGSIINVSTVGSLRPGSDEWACGDFQPPAPGFASPIPPSTADTVTQAAD